MVANAAEAAWLPLVEQARQLDPDPGLADVDDAALEGQVRDVAAQVAQLTCRWLELVAEFVVRGCWADQGARTPGQWLSWACGVAPGTAREHVRVGLALRRLPAVRERLAAGTISYSKVRAITRVATPACEEMLLHLADSAPAADLEAIIAGARRQLRRETAEADPDGAVAQLLTGPDLSRLQREDGTVEYRLRLPAAQAEAFDQQLDRLVALADRTDPQPELPDRPDAAAGHAADDGQGPADADGTVADSSGAEVAGRVPYSARRAEAVCRALAVAVAAGPDDTSGQDRHLVVVHTTLGQLTDASQPAADSFGTPRGGVAAAGTPDPGEDQHPPEDPEDVSAETPPRHGRSRPAVVAGRTRAMAVPASVLAMLTCDTLLRPATGGEPEDGHPADVGRDSRTVPAPLRRALLLRDRRCRFPGCGRTRYLHAHHVIHWADGGPTDLANLLTLCAFHHRFVHTHHWTLQPVDRIAGHYRFLPPEGDPTDPTGTLPGVSAETVLALLDPWPHALEPPWWHGDPYDLSETIDLTARIVLDPATDVSTNRPHPAHDPQVRTPSAA